ncbi:MAG: hypothetical protein H6719_32530 [Sandaracinaceae bacterium]|nr:hypothetical protein [Sandaracinaceae bacterium]
MPHRERATHLALVAGVTLALVLGTTSVARAGPWAPEAGHGYVKLWLKYLPGFWFLDAEGERHDYGGYHELFLNTYAELGLGERVALVLHAPIVRSFHLEDPRDGSYQSHLSPGDPTLSLRWQFLAADRFVMAANAGVTAPFARPGPVQTFYGTDEGNPVLGALQIGTGIWDVPMSLSAGYAWDTVYVAASVGYIFRSDGYDHVLTWTAEGGATLVAEFGVRGRITGYHSLDVWFGDEAPGHLSPSGIGNGTNYIGFSVEADYQFSPSYFVGVTLEGGVFAITRQTGGPVISLYFARRF